MTSRKSSSLSAPTSAGKSYILLLFILNSLFYKRVTALAYIVPTRALINQVSDNIQNIINENGIPDVVVSSSPIVISSDEQGLRVIYVLTQERLDSLFNSSSSQRFDLIIIDEAQMISAGSRGVLLEAVIDRAILREPGLKLIFAGPLIENPEYFSQIFNLDNASSEKNSNPVTVQNIIQVQISKSPSRSISLSVDLFGKRELVHTFETAIDLSSETDKISYVASLLGKRGSSLVYTNGKADSEKVAIKICQAWSKEKSSNNKDLITFVERHIHPQYSLVDTLPFGVAFHYGHMPALLRKELENAFRNRTISLLACTSTLLHGLNLPAKNIFIRKPTTGKGRNINSADFWNLAGRAGRLGYEMSGNVYVIDYPEWGNDVLSGRKEVKVRSYLTSGFVERASELIAYLQDEEAPSGKASDLEIIAGKLLIDYRLGRLNQTISRHRIDEFSGISNEISSCVAKISDKIKLTNDTLQKNISISPFRQQGLFQYFWREFRKLAQSP